MTDAQLELVISRHFDAPRELVYKAFTEVIENQLLVGYEDVSGIPGFEGAAHSTEMEAMAREGWMQSFTKLDTFLAG